MIRIIPMQRIRHYPRIHGRSRFFTFSEIFNVLIGFFGLWIELVILKKPNN